MVIGKTTSQKIYEILQYGQVDFDDGYWILVRDPGDRKFTDLHWINVASVRFEWIRVFNF